MQAFFYVYKGVHFDTEKNLIKRKVAKRKITPLY